MKTIKFLIPIAIIALFAGCAKQGATGPTGATGANGTNGVANITSNTYTITPGSWNNPQANEYVYNITDASLANATTDGVEIFVSTSNGIWLGLPESNLLSNGDNLEYAYENGEINIIYQYSSAPTISIGIKVVVIPPSIMVKNPNLNIKDYNQVNTLLQLQTAIQK